MHLPFLPISSMFCKFSPCRAACLLLMKTSPARETWSSSAGLWQSHFGSNPQIVGGDIH